MERVIDVWAAGLANTSDSMVISKIERTWYFGEQQSQNLEQYMDRLTTMRDFAAVVDALGFSALTQFEVLFL